MMREKGVRVVLFWDMVEPQSIALYDPGRNNLNLR